MTLTSKSSRREFYEAWQASGLEEKAFWRLNLMDTVTYGQYHGKVYRYGLELENAKLKAENERLKLEIVTAKESDLYALELVTQDDIWAIEERLQWFREWRDYFATTGGVDETIRDDYRKAAGE